MFIIIYNYIMVLTGYKIANGDDISTLFISSSNGGTPTGTIVSYLGVNDVEGWIICDGVERKNNGDFRYNALAKLGIGSGGFDNNGYTPPNFQNCFLRGCPGGTPLNSTGGSDTVTIDLDNIPSHNHTGTTSTSLASSSTQTVTHYHQLYNTGKKYAEGSGNRSEMSDWDSMPNKDMHLDDFVTAPSTMDITINIPTHNHAFTTNSTGAGKAFSIVPSYRTVNYLLKL